MSAGSYLLAWLLYALSAIALASLISWHGRHVQPVIFQFLLRMSLFSALLAPCALDWENRLLVPAIVALALNVLGLHSVPLDTALASLSGGIGIAFLLSGLLHHAMRFREWQ